MVSLQVRNNNNDKNCCIAVITYFIPTVYITINYTQQKLFMQSPGT